MSIERAIGFLCGAAVGVVLVAIILKLTKKDGSAKCKFDERQELVRGRGFKYGFAFLMIYDALYAGIGAGFEGVYYDSAFMMFLGIALAALVYISYCIWHEGYFSLNENPKRVLVAFALIALFNFIVFIGQLISGELLKTKMLTFTWANFICAMLFVIIFIELFAKWIQNKREAE